MSTPFTNLLNSVVMSCTRCGSSTGCSCWIPCPCGWTREREEACTNPDCAHWPDVPKMSPTQWAVLIDIDQSYTDGLEVAGSRKRTASILVGHALIDSHAIDGKRFVTTELGTLAVKCATMLCDEAKENGV